MPRKVYWLDRQMVPDGALVYQNSHDLEVFKSGAPFDAGFKPPVLLTLDEELRKGPLPTFFTSPAFIAKKEIHKALVKLGVDNLQSYAAVIEDPVDGRKIKDYLFLNVIGAVACANMKRSKSESLGDGMTVINELVLNAKRVPDLDMFLLAEDTDKMLISELIAKYFRESAYPDVYLEEIEQV